MPADLDLIRRLAAAEHGLAVVATTRPDGSVHSSLVNAGVLADPVTGEPALGMVVRGDAHKLTLLRRTGQASVAFRSGWEWAAADGPVRLVGPDDPRPELPAERLPELLRVIFRAAGGSHDDWAEYDRVMAAERRVAVLLQPSRIIGNSR
jgi:PPOX class probable F420-dependent enzyme